MFRSKVGVRAAEAALGSEGSASRLFVRVPPNGLERDTAAVVEGNAFLLEEMALKMLRTAIGAGAHFPSGVDDPMPRHIRPFR